MKEKKFNKIAEKIHKIFQIMGWEWFDGRPDLTRIKETMRGLEKTYDEEDLKYVGTGRIVLQKVCGKKQFSVEISED